jgi:hypothetical protein
MDEKWWFSDGLETDSNPVHKFSFLLFSGWNYFWYVADRITQ